MQGLTCIVRGESASGSLSICLWEEELRIVYAIGEPYFGIHTALNGCRCLRLESEHRSHCEDPTPS